MRGTQNVACPLNLARRAYFARSLIFAEITDDRQTDSLPTLIKSRHLVKKKKKKKILKSGKGTFYQRNVWGQGHFHGFVQAMLCRITSADVFPLNYVNAVSTPYFAVPNVFSITFNQRQPKHFHSHVTKVGATESSLHGETICNSHLPPHHYARG